MTEKYETMDTDKYIYHSSSDTIDMRFIDEELKNAGDSMKRLDIIKEKLAQYTEKNRFFIDKQ